MKAKHKDNAEVVERILTCQSCHGHSVCAHIYHSPTGDYTDCQCQDCGYKWRIYRNMDGK